MSAHARLRVRMPRLEVLSRLVLAIVCLGLVWYGLMAILLALEVAPSTVDELSGYRSIYDYLAGLRAADVTSDVRLIVGLGGLAAFLVFGLIVWQTLPRPYLAGPELELPDDGRGRVVVEARAIERAAEAAALEHSAVTGASARYGVHEIALGVSVRRAREVPALLHEVQQRAVDALRRHELPVVALVVTVDTFDPNPRKELA